MECGEKGVQPLIGLGAQNAEDDISNLQAAYPEPTWMGVPISKLSRGALEGAFAEMASAYSAALENQRALNEHNAQMLKLAYEATTPPKPWFMRLFARLG